MVAPPGLEPGSRGDSIVEQWKLNDSRTPHAGPVCISIDMILILHYGAIASRPVIDV